MGLRRLAPRVDRHHLRPHRAVRRVRDDALDERRRLPARSSATSRRGAPGTLPSMVPILFELTILFSAFGAVLGMFGLNRLPHHHHPVFESERFRLASDDKFFISIEAEDPKFDVASHPQRCSRARTRRTSKSSRRKIREHASPSRRPHRVCGLARGPRRLPRADERRPADPARAQHVRPGALQPRVVLPVLPRPPHDARPRRGHHRPRSVRGRPRGGDGPARRQVGLRADDPPQIVQRARRHGEVARPRPGALQHLLRAVPRRDRRRQGHGRVQARQADRPLRVARLRAAARRTRTRASAKCPTGSSSRPSRTASARCPPTVRRSPSPIAGPSSATCARSS